MKVYLDLSKPLQGIYKVPPDKSISHRGVLFSYLSKFPSKIENLNLGQDVFRSLSLITDLGSSYELNSNKSEVILAGRRVAPEEIVVDCGNSGTTIRLGMGLVAPLLSTCIFTGDESLKRRPMNRVALPLSLLGARIEGEGEMCFPPVKVTGNGLVGKEYVGQYKSAQVKSAFLLAALFASTPSVYVEPIPTRAHTEELLQMQGANIEIKHGNDATRIKVENSSDLSPLDFAVPGDPSQAAFFIAGALLKKKGNVTVENIYFGSNRVGFYDALRDMGAAMRIDVSGSNSQFPIATISVTYSELRPTIVPAEMVPSLIDEIPILSVLMAKADGRSEIHGIEELRVKESDRASAVVNLLTQLGRVAVIEKNTLYIEGKDDWFATPSDLITNWDHRMVMAASVAALNCKGGVTIPDVEAVQTSFPGFFKTFLGVR